VAGGPSYLGGMFDPQMELLRTVLGGVVAQSGSEASWAEADEALEVAGERDEEVRAIVGGRDLDGLRVLVEQWSGGQRHLLAHDREVLKRAMKAYRKSLKVTRLDEESKLGGSAMTGGRSSSIVGIVPPARYPSAVWEELARQKRLIAAGHGTYELPPE